MRQFTRGPTPIFLLILVIALATPAIAQTDQRTLAIQEFEALLRIKPQADKGDRQAQFLLGGLYTRGEGVRQDDEQAAAWWRKAAEQGLAEAQNELGAALADGRGVPVNAKEAVTWYRKAAEQGLAVAQANLGTMYWNGTGVGKNTKQAVEWYRKAAEQQLGWAQFYLGDAYASGVGVSKDQTQAAQWYRKAAEQDYTDAQFELGVMYLSAIVGAIPRDKSREAYGEYWLGRAVQNGHENAGKALEKVLRRVPRATLPASTAVRAQPDAKAAVIRHADQRTAVYVLNSPSRLRDWVAVYLEDAHTVGFVSAEALRGN